MATITQHWVGGGKDSVQKQAVKIFQLCCNITMKLSCVSGIFKQLALRSRFAYALSYMHRHCIAGLLEQVKLHLQAFISMMVSNCLEICHIAPKIGTCSYLPYTIHLLHSNQFPFKYKHPSTIVLGCTNHYCFGGSHTHPGFWKTLLYTFHLLLSSTSRSGIACTGCATSAIVTNGEQTDF